MTPDSTVFNEDYAKRAKELGHGIITTMEHGWQGRYIEGYELAKKYDLKFVFGSEVYWVKDRTEKDRSNCHMCIFARNENGRRAINDILSEANISGYYYKPRVDLELIMSLPENDVIITSACIAFHKYEDIDDIILSLQKKFKHNFYLEVQYHNTEPQRKLNRHILDLHYQYQIPLIMGCDSHYILESQYDSREAFLYAKGMHYEDEEGWYLDYPSGNEAYRRFTEQCVLSHDEILEAMNNTNVFLEVEEYDCPCFNKQIKMPSIYPEMSQEEKDELYENIIWSAWEDYKWERPENEWMKYIKEIQKEIDIVHKTKHADYFLLNREVIHQGIRNGGVLTQSGRGSSVSFITNKLIGFTNVDRVAAKVHMYPERFMSVERILEAGSLADIDFNVAKQEPFALAQEQVLGKEHAVQMIAYQTMGPPAAWKAYAKASDIDFQTSNAVSNQIKKWQKAVAHADEEDKDSIDIYDYIDRQYHDIFDQSKDYRGIITSMSPHPCSYLLYQGDIRKEIGLIFVKPSVGEGRICCLMDGHWAEDYKFLKNDLLKVNVVELISNSFKRARVPIPSVNELLEMCTPDDPAWKIYEKQCTLGINQCEQPGTASRVATYKPKNISELCAFIAAIRPGFKSMYKIFESRKHFDYGLPSFDSLIQTEEMDNSFVLYQEMLMQTLNYAGIPMGECSMVIKHIAKKRVQKLMKYKEIFIPGFTNKIMDVEHKSKDEALKATKSIWQILEDSGRYSFNASHAYCVAVDSLYGAYLKSHYPLEFYESFLNILSEKGAKDRMNAVRAEAESYFGIKFPPYKFGQDNREIRMDKEHNSINNTLAAIKGYSKSIAETLYECSQCVNSKNFITVLQWLDEHSIKRAKIEPLVEIGYFDQFGTIPVLKELMTAFDELKQGKAKKVSMDKINNSSYLKFVLNHGTNKLKNGKIGKSYTITDMDGLLKEITDYIYNNITEDVSYKQKIEWQEDHLGYIDLLTGNKDDAMKLFISKIFPLKSARDQGIWGYSIQTKSIYTGKTSSMTITRLTYQMQPIKEKDIIEVNTYHKNKRNYWYLDTYRVIT